MVNAELYGQKDLAPGYDTITVTPSHIIVFRDSILIPLADTTVVIPKDLKYKVKKNPYQKTKAFYDSLYYKSNKEEISRGVYNLLISYKPEEENLSASDPVASSQPFEKYKGKTIQNVRFLKVDILEGSVNDTTRIAGTGFGRLLNKTHIDTRDWVLRGYLFVEPGDKLDPGSIADNERVIRDLPGIQDARILVTKNLSDTNSVNLVIVTQDIFPLTPTLSISSLQRMSVGLFNNNTLGWGYKLGGRFLYDAKFRNPYGYILESSYPNIAGTLIDGSISYNKAFGTDYFRIHFSRMFIMPRIKWGGELDLGWIQDTAFINYFDTTYAWLYQGNYQDIWLGRSFQIGGETSRKNLVLSARYRREQYHHRPYSDVDTNIVFHNSNNYFGKIGYRILNYYNTSMIRSFGVTENIPYGFAAGLTLGFSDGEFGDRTYIGLYMGAAKYFPKIGYFGGNLLMGGALRNMEITQGIFELELFYYTPLLKTFKYSTRHFLRLRLRGAATKDLWVQINFGSDVRNLNQEHLHGNSTLVLKYEYVLFTPWFFYGFRFAPYLFADVGFISSSRNPLIQSSLYAALGLGVRIRNESLAFKTIVLSFGYLPKVLEDQSRWFVNFSLGEPPLVTVIDFEKPDIIRREVIYPY
jgi:hypothetical protein